MDIQALSDTDLDTAAHDAMRANDTTAARLLTEIDRRQDAQRARLAQPGALASAAAWYAAHDIAVFPLRRNGKAPLLRSAHPAGSPERATCRGECGRPGHGLYDATADADTVTAWWRRAPWANIGVPTGHRWDVIDVDGPKGFDSLARLAGQLPGRVAQSRTPGNPGAGRPGGVHYWVTATGDGCATSILPGLDYRGAGGYVVAPPSHGPHSGQYAWSVGLEIAGAL